MDKERKTKDFGGVRIKRQVKKALLNVPFFNLFSLLGVVQIVVQITFQPTVTV